MAQPTHITVTAPKGIRTPIGHRDGTDLAGMQLHVTEHTIDRVVYSQDVRRSIGRGDLLPCDSAGNLVTLANIAIAAAPDALPEHRMARPTNRSVEVKQVDSVDSKFSKEG